MIESIVIENFQSLRDPVEIPLAPVTLVYGPNSAGKSALLDALNFVHAIFTEDSEKCRSLAARYAHMLESNSSQLPIKIRIRGRARLFDWNSVSCINLRNRSRFVEASDDEFYEIWEPKDSVISEGFGDVHIEWCIECWPRVQDAYDALRSLSINVNGCPALLLEVEDDESINVCLSFDPKVFGPTFTDLARQYKVKPGKDGSYYLRVDLETRPLRVIKSDVNLDRKPFFETMTVLANWLFERTAEILAPPVIVSADRGVIDDRELIVFAAENGRTGLPQSFTSLPDRELLSKEMLTGSRSSIIERMAIARLREDFGSKYSLGTLTREPIDHFVNRCLVDHLFLDVGYQVRFDVCEVLPAVGTSGAVPNKTLSDRPMRAALLLCYLTDRDGRQLTFQDVGTGISCVLPVLGALYTGFSFVQQPELHLHPALQAALADVAIETANRLNEADYTWEKGRRGNVCHILETHSEYLLLRCLKRIRQTTLGMHPDNSPLRLMPEQISVLYFDPRSDGTTRVRRIRVTEDGDFIDRWPQGFFEERGRELFDE